MLWDFISIKRVDFGALNFKFRQCIQENSFTTLEVGMQELRRLLRQYI